MVRSRTNSTTRWEARSTPGARDVPHRLVNTGTVTYQNIVIELKPTAADE